MGWGNSLRVGSAIIISGEGRSQQVCLHLYVRFGDAPDKELRNFGGICHLTMLLGKNRLLY